MSDAVQFSLSDVTDRFVADGYGRFGVKSCLSPGLGASRIMQASFNMASANRSHILPREFYCRETVEVAEDLLGKQLVRVKGRTCMTGKIVEVEAYRASDDPASHAFRGLTPRNAPMFGEPGHAYIYFTYGNHYCLNVTTHVSGIPGAVLIRAIEPLEGLSVMRRLRPNLRGPALTNGPGKLTKALGINQSLNKVDMTRLGPLFIVDAGEEHFEIARSARVGIRVGKRRLWRFYISGNAYVSKR